MAEARGRRIPGDLQELYEARDLEVRALLCDRKGAADWVPVALDLKHLLERLGRAEEIIVEAKNKIDRLSRGHHSALQACKRLTAEAEHYQVCISQLENQVRRLRRQRDMILGSVKVTDELTERLDAISWEPDSTELDTTELDTTEPDDALFSDNLPANGVS